MTYSQKQKLSAINAAFTKYFGRAANQSELNYYSKPGRFSKLNKNILGDQKNLLPQYQLNRLPPEKEVSPDITNPDITNPNITNPDITNQQPSQDDLIKKIVENLTPKIPAPPSFEQSGLYDEAAVMAQAHQDYDPTFQSEQKRLAENQQIALRDLDLQQKLLSGQQLSDYYNRGLSRSGVMDAATSNLKNLQRQDYQQAVSGKEFDKNALEQRQRATLADIRAKAYQNAFQRYLNQFGTK